MITTFIKTVTLTYILTDIYIIIVSINISCECSLYDDTEDIHIEYHVIYTSPTDIYIYYSY